METLCFFKMTENEKKFKERKFSFSFLKSYKNSRGSKFEIILNFQGLETFCLLFIFIKLFKVGEFLDCSERDSQNTFLKIRRKILCEYDREISPVNAQKNAIAIYFSFLFKAFSFVSSTIKNSILDLIKEFIYFTERWDERNHNTIVDLCVVDWRAIEMESRRIWKLWQNFCIFWLTLDSRYFDGGIVNIFIII